MSYHNFMKETKDKRTYFLYARKSSESEDRQMQSIEDQTEKLEEYARGRGLTVKGVYSEARSAKKPHNRPAFAEMLDRITAGEADGILCWKINRLTRNPIDSGQLSWMLQQGIIKSIQTYDREYLPTDNVILFNVESGMATQYILDLSKDVKRGMEKRMRMGWKNGQAPTGYLNHRDPISGMKILVKDPERFDLVRKMWDLMLTGNHTVSEIVDTANKDWGFRGRRTRRTGGKPISKSTLYKIFNSQFYAGVIEHKEEIIVGKHPAMITLDEFDRVQELLGKKGKRRPKTHNFPYTGTIRCGECNAMITATKKTKFIKVDDCLRDYTYYHCTKQKKYAKCKQPSVKVEELEEQIDRELQQITILPEFRDWALEALNEMNDQEILDRSTVYETQHKALVQAQRELDNLTKMRYRDLIDDEMYLKEKKELKNTISRLEIKLRDTETRAKEWFELTEKTFDFATYARVHFKNGDLETKKQILRTIGTEYTLTDKVLKIKPKEWLVPIKENYPALEQEYYTLELDKTLVNTTQNEAFASLRSQWFGDQDLNLDYLGQNQASYH